MTARKKIIFFTLVMLTLSHKSWNLPVPEPTSTPQAKPTFNPKESSWFSVFGRYESSREEEEEKRTIDLPTRNTKTIPKTILARLLKINEENFRTKSIFVDSSHYYTIAQAPTKTTIQTEDQTIVEKTIIQLQKQGEVRPEYLNIILRTEYYSPSAGSIEDIMTSQQSRVKKIEYFTSKDNPEGWVVGEIVSPSSIHGYEKYYGSYIVTSIVPIEKTYKTTTWYRLEPISASSGEAFSLVYKQRWTPDGTLSDSSDWPTPTDIRQTFSATWSKFMDYAKRTKTPGTR